MEREKEGELKEVKGKRIRVEGKETEKLFYVASTVSFSHDCLFHLVINSLT